MLNVSEDGEERGERARRVEGEGGRVGRRKASVGDAAAARRRRRSESLPLRRQMRGGVGMVCRGLCVCVECDVANEEKQ